MRSLLLTLLALFAAAPAAAQHCWPAMVALVVRDANGAVLDPRQIDSVGITPKRSAEAGDFNMRRVQIDTLDEQSYARGSIPALVWAGQGACRVTLREVVLRKGGDTMRLWMDLRVSTLEHPGPSLFALNTPPFAPGTWRLDVCALPPGESGRFASVPARWARVSSGGGAGGAWQGPQGCEGGPRP